ncbi:hypothetical protein GCM10022631_40260 [Deinococcus rubellus]|uniref:CBS domain-containing protein n=1 Tax=Deinococcus rubellus TaxID=1889240 RepID=A0ABY5YK88_9DEIO|nr:CBS domain-containing protein [Deinococcus rubellus]UWX65509.1 CBS domain-containing protein [Deinococcus rubellus]
MLVKDAMHIGALFITLSDPLSAAAARMQAQQIKRLPVFEGARLVGLLTERDIKRHLPALHENLTPWEFICRVGQLNVSDVMAQPVLTTIPEETLTDAVRRMLDHRVGGLPVLENGQLSGMLTLTDVLRAEVKQARLKWGSVRQHMTVNTISVRAESPAREASAKLNITGLRVLPVLDGDVMVGVIHERDLREAVEHGKVGHGDTVLADQFFLEGVTVREMMRPPSEYVLDTNPMRDALSRMLEMGIHGLPVISEGGRLLGVLTISDVLRTLLGEAHPDQAAVSSGPKEA